MLYLFLVHIILLLQKTSSLFSIQKEQCSTSTLNQQTNIQIGFSPSMKKFYRHEGKVVNFSEKPLELLNKLIKHHSRPGDYIVDLFAGSGSATAAALMSGRNVLTLELSPESCEAIKARIPQLVEDEEEESKGKEEDPEEDPKDKNSKAISVAPQKVCSICGKGPEETLMICAHCDKLGHSTCTPFFTHPNYQEDDKESFFWCSKEHYKEVTTMELD